MTAVLEPQAPGHSFPAMGYDDLLPEPAAPLVQDHPAAPFHCGAPMTAGPDLLAALPLASFGWAPLEFGSPEWSCACGFTSDSGPAGDPLEAVRLASARLEGLQWELDAAQERFESALLSASRLGADRDALGRAAGLSVAELQEVLGGGPL